MVVLRGLWNLLCLCEGCICFVVFVVGILGGVMNVVNELGRLEFGFCGGCFKISFLFFFIRLCCVYVINVGFGVMDLIIFVCCFYMSVCCFFFFVYV